MAVFGEQTDGCNRAEVSRLSNEDLRLYSGTRISRKKTGWIPMKNRREPILVGYAAKLFRTALGRAPGRREDALLGVFLLDSV
jgi:hypothetical protein